MPAFLWEGPLVMISFLLPRVTVQVCEKGLLGRDCTFRCHCSMNAECLPDGQCPGGGGCKPGYFGLACQFENLAYQRASSDTAGYLIDGNDTTCNTDTHASSIAVTFNTRLSVSWFRVHTKEFAHLLDFTVIINNSTSCGNEKRFIQGRHDVDVTCGQPVMLQELRLRGDIAPTVCSIYLSRDLLCPSGVFGLQCHQNCTCNKTEDCSPVTGVCAHTCPPGKFGHNCSYNCSQQCYQNVCSPHSGVCDQCYVGFKGDQCDTACDPGTHGVNCSTRCPASCLKHCNHTSGDCTSTDEKVQSSRSFLWLLVPSGILLLIVIVVMYLCKEEDGKPSQDVEDDGTTTATITTGF